jgi:hypothetical protein
MQYKGLQPGIPTRHVERHMPKGQQNVGKNNKPKLTTAEKKKKKNEKKALKK